MLEQVEILKDGSLAIYRNGEKKIAQCPNVIYQCGDHCALFGEPEPKTYGTAIKICNGRILRTKIFKDFRKKANE